MKGLPDRTTESGQRCDSEFCQFLASLEFKADSDATKMLKQALTKRFLRGRAYYYYKLPVVKVKTIAARKSCPFCRFASTINQSNTRADILSDTIFLTLFSTAMRFNIEYQSANGWSRRITSRFGEEIAFLNSGNVSSPEAGKLVNPDGINYLRLTSWLKLCEELHDVCSQTATGRGIQLRNSLPLLLVDVQNMCLANIP